MNESIASKPMEFYSREHLYPGVKPIIISVGDWDAHVAKEYQEPKRDFLEKLNASVVEDIFFATQVGEDGSVFSHINSADKRTNYLMDCTSLVVVGIDKESGKNISFITHQDPKTFLNNQYGQKDLFTKHLSDFLNRIKLRCKSGTIDVVIVGGFADPHVENINFYPVSPGIFSEMYLDSIDLLTTEVKNNLGFEPEVFNGPKYEWEYDEIFFDNENRRLYFIRKKVNPEVGSFSGSRVRELKDKWELRSKKKPKQ
ncbi:MAG: hypothetical protein HW400_860 [Candidatus Levybacteria bacterium]|nr:hypothetical protein [Candidatus Levybacteria bacterium]